MLACCLEYQDMYIHVGMLAEAILMGYYKNPITIELQKKFKKTIKNDKRFNEEWLHFGSISAPSWLPKPTNIALWRPL